MATPPPRQRATASRQTRTRRRWRAARRGRWRQRGWAWPNAQGVGARLVTTGGCGSGSERAGQRPQYQPQYQQRRRRHRRRQDASPCGSCAPRHRLVRLLPRAGRFGLALCVGVVVVFRNLNSSLSLRHYLLRLVMCVFLGTWAASRAACARREVSGGARDAPTPRLPRGCWRVKWCLPMSQRKPHETAKPTALRRIDARPAAVAARAGEGFRPKRRLASLFIVCSSPHREPAVPPCCRLPLTRPAFS